MPDEMTMTARPNNGNFEELCGKRFGKLLVLEFAGRQSDKKGSPYFWRCCCVCGEEKTVSGVYLRVAGSKASCGCSKASRKHGLRSHPLYLLWCQIKQRCTNPNHRAYRYYGGKGVAVCARWSGESGFANFVADMGERPSASHSVDRIDVDGPYSPENCCWSTWKEQHRNRSNNVLIEYDGRSMPLSAWIEELGVPRGLVASRLARGWSVEAALTVPSRKYALGKPMKQGAGS